MANFAISANDIANFASAATLSVSTAYGTDETALLLVATEEGSARIHRIWRLTPLQWKYLTDEGNHLLEAEACRRAREKLPEAVA